MFALRAMRAQDVPCAAYDDIVTNFYGDATQGLATLFVINQKEPRPDG